MSTIIKYTEQSSIPPIMEGSPKIREVLQHRQDQKITKIQVTWMGWKNINKQATKTIYALWSSDPEMTAEVDGCDPPTGATGGTSGVRWA